MNDDSDDIQLTFLYPIFISMMVIWMGQNMQHFYI